MGVDWDNSIYIFGSGSSDLGEPLKGADKTESRLKGEGMMLLNFNVAL